MARTMLGDSVVSSIELGTPEDHARQLLTALRPALGDLDVTRLAMLDVSDSLKSRQRARMRSRRPWSRGHVAGWLRQMAGEPSMGPTLWLSVNGWISLSGKMVVVGWPHDDSMLVVVASEDTWRYLGVSGSTLEAWNERDAKLWPMAEWLAC